MVLRLQWHHPYDYSLYDINIQGAKKMRIIVITENGVFKKVLYDRPKADDCFLEYDTATKQVTKLLNNRVEFHKEGVLEISDNIQMLSRLLYNIEMRTK